MLLSVGFSPYLTKTDNYNDFGILALVSFEFFVFEKVSLSGSFFISNNNLFKNSSDVTIHSYGIVPSIHYYFIDKENFYLKLLLPY